MKLSCGILDVAASFRLSSLEYMITCSAQLLYVPETASALSVYLKRQAQGIPGMGRREHLVSITIKLRDAC